MVGATPPKSPRILLPFSQNSSFGIVLVYIRPGSVQAFAYLAEAKEATFLPQSIIHLSLRLQIEFSLLKDDLEIFSSTLNPLNVLGYLRPKKKIGSLTTESCRGHYHLPAH